MYGAGYKLEKWKEKPHDLNHDLTLFRVLGIYNFAPGMIWQGTWTGWGECIDCPDGQVDQDIFTCVDCPNGQIEVDGVCKEGK